jgi:hypothetical protein
MPSPLRTTTALSALVALTLISAAASAQPGARALFNGRDLTGWINHGTEKWYVENEELVCESGPDAQYGYLKTEATYKNFDLTLEFNQETNGNSGVFLRSSVEGTRVSGWQVEVAPPGNNTGGIYESYGRGWLTEALPDEKQKALKFGEWNKMRIVALGDRVVTWVNGMKIADLRDERIGAANGSIALQIHDGGGIKVRWRNLMLRNLRSAADARLTDLPPDWVQWSQGRFTYFTPIDMEWIPVQGIDSDVAKLRGERFVIGYDLGRYSDPMNRDASMWAFTETNVTVGAHEGRVVSFTRSLSPEAIERLGMNAPHFVGVHFPAILGGGGPTTTKLTFWVRCREAADREDARRIVDSIRFPNR